MNTFQVYRRLVKKTYLTFIIFLDNPGQKPFDIVFVINIRKTLIKYKALRLGL